MKEDGCTCQGCGNTFKIDIMIPNHLWEKITPRPESKEGGLLCGSCIIKRLEKISSFDYWFLTKD